MGGAVCVRGGDEFEKQARKRTCHSKTLCMPDSGCSSMVGKRGDGGLREEDLCLAACCMMGRRMTR